LQAIFHRKPLIIENTIVTQAIAQQNSYVSIMEQDLRKKDQKNNY